MRPLPIAALASIMFLGSAYVAAQDFRVETDVFVGKKKEPVSQYLTVFKGGVVYDFMLDGAEEVTMYDVKRGRFLLLDPDRRVQTVVTLDELRQLTADIKVEAQNAGDENVRFLADPVFQVNLNQQERRVVLESKRMTYSAQGIEPSDKGVVRRYTDFADGYARLNGLRLGNVPPFARMQLNEQLASQGWIPEEVIRTIPAQAVLTKNFEVRSHHLYSWVVLPNDEKRIAAADGYLTTFKNVPISEYLKWPKRVAKAP